MADLERRIVSLEDTTAREISTLQSMTDVLRQESEQLKAFVDASLGVEDTVPRLYGPIEDDNQSCMEMS